MKLEDMKSDRGDTRLYGGHTLATWKCSNKPVRILPTKAWEIVCKWVKYRVLLDSDSGLVRLPL